MGLLPEILLDLHPKVKLGGREAQPRLEYSTGYVLKSLAQV